MSPDSVFEVQIVMSSEKRSAETMAETMAEEFRSEALVQPDSVAERSKKNRSWSYRECFRRMVGRVG
jgi:hypothetical protein